MRWELPLSKLSFRWQITLLGALVVVLFLAVLTAGVTALQYSTSAVLNDEKKSLLATTRELVRQYEISGGAERENSNSPLQDPATGSSREVLVLLSRFVVQKTAVSVAGFYSTATDQIEGYASSGDLANDQTHGPFSKDNSDLQAAVTQVARTAVLTHRSSDQVLGGGRNFTLIMAIPIGTGHNYIGSAWAVESLPSIPGANRFRAYLIAVALGAAALFCVALTFLVVRNLQNGVRKIEEGLGGLEQSLASHLPAGNDPEEIKRIVLAINRLGATLKGNIERERQLQNRLRHSERLSALGKLVAGVAHEVRNPLATIRLRVQMCARNSPDSGVHECCEVALAEIGRLDRIVSRLLNFAEPMTLDAKPTSIAKLVEQRLNAFHHIAEDKRVRFITHFGAKGHVLVLDQGRMAQVFDNVIQNAIEAMSDEGGTLSAALSTGRIVTGENAICIEFRDTGKGIHVDVLDRIFDPFFTTKPFGTGLGLSICHELVRAHDGEINLDSREGEGTTVRILLPLEPRTLHGKAQLENRTHC